MSQAPRQANAAKYRLDAAAVLDVDGIQQGLHRGQVFGPARIAHEFRGQAAAEDHVHMVDPARSQDQIPEIAWRKRDDMRGIDRQQGRRLAPGAALLLEVGGRVGSGLGLRLEAATTSNWNF